MQKRILLHMMAGLAVTGMLLAGCAPAAAPAPTAKPAATSVPKPADTSAPKPAATTPQPAAPGPSPKPAADQPRYGGILDRVYYEDPRSFDVHQEASHVVLVRMANCYNGLVKYDSQDVDKVAPDLAERWEVSPDGATWTFFLRKGVKWHDGVAFTAEDAKFNLERIAFWKDHKIVSPMAGALLTAVKGVEAPDANTVKVTLKYPSGSFLGNAAGGFVLMLPKHVIEAKGDMKKDVVGTGPFKFKTYAPGVSFDVTRNTDYFIEKRPYLDGIRVYTVKDEASQFAAFRTGRVKMTAMGSKGLTPAQAEVLKREMADTAVVQKYAPLSRLQLQLRVTKAPWSDIRVRKAIDLAIDRQAAIKINFGVGSLGASMDPMGLWGIPDEEMKQKPGYRQPKDADIAEAKRLLGEAGFPSGFKTPMLGRTGGTTEKMGVFAKDQLAKIGIEADLGLKERAVQEGLLVRGDFDITPITDADAVDDPDASLSWYTSEGARNFGRFSDKQVDDLFQKQAGTIDVAERKKIVRQVQERLLDLVPYPIIYWDVWQMAHWQEVRGYKPGPGPYAYNSLVDVWLAK